MKTYTKFEFVSAALVLITSYQIALGADWPHWKGPDYNGMSTEKDWDAGKIKEGVKPLWQASIGTGFSSFAVSSGKVYAMGNTGKKDVDESKHEDVVYCFDAETGKELWRYNYPQKLDPKYYEGGTLASPTVDGDKVYTISKDGDTFCLDANTGKEIWHKNLLKELEIKRTTWGQAGSPLIIDNMVIYNVGMKGVALEKTNGNLIWENGKEPSGYATAVPYTIGGQKCIILFGSKEVMALIAATGKELWKVPWQTNYDVNAADPVIEGNQIFISSGYGVGCAVLKVDGNNVTEVWCNKNMCNKMNGSVLWDGYIYGVDEGGELRCLNFKTGELAWAQKGFGMGSIMIADGKLIVMGEKGNLVIAEAAHDSYKVISEANILSGRCWTVPVLVNGRIYVRNAAGDMVCLDVKKESKGTKETKAVSSSNNWPQWLGPNRDNKSAETGLLKVWPEGGPNLLWSAKNIGKGYSSASIAEGTIYTTGTVEKEGILFAFDMDGNLKWKKSYGPEWVGEFPSARCTPTVDEGSVYIITGKGAVACLDAQTGERKWFTDVFTEFEGKTGGWGYAEMPLVYGDKVFCTPGGKKATMVALDKKTGKTIWVSESIGENNSYCSPCIIQAGDRIFIANMLEKSNIFVDPDDGKIVFQENRSDYQEKPKGITAVTPLFYKNCIYTTSGYDTGSAMHEISADATGLTRKWVDTVLDCHHGGVVMVDGHIYGTNWKGNGDGDWICLEWNTGKVMYEHHWINKGEITYADGMLYCYEEKEGNVALVKASPAGFDIVSSFKITEGTGEHWALPVVCEGRLYIRHGDTLMVYDIKAK